MNNIWNSLHELAENKAADINTSRHAAAISLRGRVLATGVNKRKSHPLAAKYQSRPSRIYLHAELDAIIKYVSKYGTEGLDRCELHVIRITPTDQRAMSKPCAGCMKAISAFGINHIHWSETECTFSSMVL